MAAEMPWTAKKKLIKVLTWILWSRQRRHLGRRSKWNNLPAEAVKVDFNNRVKVTLTDKNIVRWRISKLKKKPWLGSLHVNWFYLFGAYNFQNSFYLAKLGEVPKLSGLCQKRLKVHSYINTVSRKFNIVCFLSLYLQQAMDNVISVDLHGWN